MGQQFEDVFGYMHLTTSEIARGGQGAVFKTQNPNIAVKLELNKEGTGFNTDINQNDKFNYIRLLPIPKEVNITLPQAVLKNQVGYVMTLLDDMASFESIFDYSFDRKKQYLNAWLNDFAESAPDFVDVMGQYISSGGRRKRLFAYLRVAAMLSFLHTSGLVYCDFSAKNAFVSSENDKCLVWLIDADNLNYQEKTLGGGYYTPGYGAPEVMKGRGCTFYSDAYAFAISLFWQLTGTHPFKGALLDGGIDDDFVDDAEEKANAGELPWILDKDDDSNNISTQIPSDLVIGGRLLKLFDRTFCKEGKEKRHTRPTLIEWGTSLAQEFDSSIKCKHCEMEYSSEFKICPWCDTQNTVIKMKSSCGENHVWDYANELAMNTEITVPKRIITGYKASEIDEKAFVLCFDDQGLKMAELHDSFDWSVSVDNGKTYIDVYGSVKIPNCCLINCTDKEARKTIVIEVTTE